MLILLSLPIMLIAALAIRIDSPGPILYRGERVGLHGASFRGQVSQHAHRRRRTVCRSGPRLATVA